MKMNAEKNKPAREQVRGQVRGQVEVQVKRIILILNKENSKKELMEKLDLNGRRNFIENYLTPALEAELIEMTQPNSPNSPTQKYRLTDKGLELKKRLEDRS